MKLLAGSYERFLFGFELKSPKGQESDVPEAVIESQKLGSAFSYGAHLGPIKSLAVSGHVAVSGGTDDVIKIYDLKARSDMGALLQHEGGVTCLQLHGPWGHPTHLVSGGEDGTLCVWDTDKWQHLISLKGHKGALNDLSVHPSGRLALSVSRDSTLRMWSLVQGKAAFHTRLRREADLLHFAPREGETYTLAQGVTLSVRNSEDGKETRQMAQLDRVLAMTPYLDNVVFSGGEKGVVRGWDYRVPDEILTLDSAHTRRIKGLAVSLGDNGPMPAMIASASSDGSIKVWDPRMLGANGGPPVPMRTAETKARLTCLAMGGYGGGMPLFAGRMEREGEGAGEQHEALPSGNGEKEREEGGEGVESGKQKGKRKGGKQQEGGSRAAGVGGGGVSDGEKGEGRRVGENNLEGPKRESKENDGGVSTIRKRSKGKQVGMEGEAIAKKVLKIK